MVKKKHTLPKENNLVICTVFKISPHGAFAKLDEYEGMEGFIHISEVASTWIKNIRDFVKKGQKTVAKVLRVNPGKFQVDLSLRRVDDAQKKKKMQEWKRSQKADKLMELAGKEIGKDLDVAYREVGFKLEDEYGEIYGGFEEISLLGEDALKDLDIPEEWHKPLIATAKENVATPNVEITGYIELTCPLPDGVGVIKETLSGSFKEEADVQLKVNYIKSPRFSVTVDAPDYKTAEEALKRYADRAIEMIMSKGGSGKFIRGKAG